tara:strand:- start:575 stop:868 length:294 start_codon:yes stop_codon:yes gene_type:complete
MVNNKKDKIRKIKELSIVRTKDERKYEVKKIIKKLCELQLSNNYEPIQKLYNIMHKYINEGERIIVNIPFSEINKKIEGILPVNIKEQVIVKLTNII